MKPQRETKGEKIIAKIEGTGRIDEFENRSDPCRITSLFKYKEGITTYTHHWGSVYIEHKDEFWKKSTLSGATYYRMRWGRPIRYIKRFHIRTARRSPNSRRPYRFQVDNSTSVVDSFVIKAEVEEALAEFYGFPYPAPFPTIAHPIISEIFEFFENRKFVSNVYRYASLPISKSSTTKELVINSYGKFGKNLARSLNSDTPDELMFKVLMVRAGRRLGLNSDVIANEISNVVETEPAMIMQSVQMVPCHRMEEFLKLFSNLRARRGDNRRLFSSMIQNPHLIMDSLNMLERVALYRNPIDYFEVRDVGVIHQVLTEHLRNLRPIPMNCNFSPPEPADFSFYGEMGIDGQILPSGLKIQLPTGPEDLHEWGIQMRNCIGSYQDSTNKSNILFALCDNKGKMKYNVQVVKRVDGYQVVQYYGPCNQYPDRKDYHRDVKAIESLIEEAMKPKELVNE